jgi:DEAD/DEAH box helicase domain-containing protein
VCRGAPPRDFDDQPERGPLLEPPRLAFEGDYTEVEHRALLLSTRRGAKVFTINDNAGRLFQMFRRPDCVVVPDRALYAEDPLLPRCDGSPDHEGAIGHVTTTDVLVVGLNPAKAPLPGPKGIVLLGGYGMPAGRAALWSLAELLRIACATELDVSPAELLVGLQPQRVNGELTARIFLADSLENGAGYSTYLGQPDVLERVFNRILNDFREVYEGAPHGAECDSSCPDCLRSWENRHVHPLLDWRLALDLAEIAVGQGPRLSRWDELGDRRAKAFVEGFRAALPGLEALRVAGLPAIMDRSGRRMAILGHPLWRADPEFYMDVQARADVTGRSQHGASAVRAYDVWSLGRRPYELFAWLKG